MAFPKVTASAISVEDLDVNTARDIALPAASVGQALILFINLGRSFNIGTPPAGYTELLNTYIGSAKPEESTSVFGRVVTGSEGATIAFQPSGTATSSHIAIAVDLPTGNLNDIEFSTPVGAAASVIPDSSAISPSWGITDTLFIDIVAQTRQRTMTNYPATFTDNNISAASAGSANWGSQINIASKESAVATEDAGAWLISANTDWLAFTMAVPSDAPTVVMADFKVQRGKNEIPLDGDAFTLTAGTDYIAPASTALAFIRQVGANSFGTGVSNSQYNGTTTRSVTGVDNPTNLLTSITISRNGPTTDALQVAWEIPEYTGPAGGPNEWIVRHVESITATSAGTATVDSGLITGVITPTKVVTIITGVTATHGGRTDIGNKLYTTEYIDGSSVVRLTKSPNTTIAGTNQISIAVIEFTGSNWNIQRIPHTYVASATDEAETITTIASLSQAFIIHQSMTDNDGSGPDGGSQNVWFDTTSSILFHKQQIDTGASAVAYVIENTQTAGTPMNVSHYSGTRANLAGGVNPDIFTHVITAVADIAQTSIMGEGVLTTTTSDSHAGMLAFELTSTTAVTMERGRDEYNRDYRFSVVEWPTAAIPTPRKTLPLPKVYHPDFRNPGIFPKGPVEIDWSNPLTKGLVFATFLEGGKTRAILGGGADASVDEGGASLDGWNQTNGGTTASILKYDRPQGLDFKQGTVLTTYEGVEASVNRAKLFITTDVEFQMYAAADSGYLGQLDFQIGNINFRHPKLMFNAAAIGIEHKISGTWDQPNSVRTITINGDKVSGGSAFPLVVTSYASYTMMNRFDAIRSARGKVRYNLLWNRVLTDQEQAAVQANVYDLLKPAQPMQYMVGSAENTGFESKRQGLLDGLVGDGSEPAGWNALVTSIPVTAIQRTSDTVVTITLPALAIDITVLDTVTPTIPSDILVSGTTAVSTTFGVTAVAGSNEVVFPGTGTIAVTGYASVVTVAAAPLFTFIEAVSGQSANSGTVVTSSLASVSAGNLLVASLTTDVDNLSNLTPPADFILGASYLVSNRTVATYYKIANGTETTFTYTNTAGAALLAVRQYLITGNAVEVSAFTTGIATSLDNIAIGPVSSVADDLIYTVAFQEGSANLLTADFDDDIQTPAQTGRLTTADKNSTGVDATATFTFDATMLRQSGLIVVFHITTATPTQVDVPTGAVTASGQAATVTATSNTNPTLVSTLTGSIAVAGILPVVTATTASNNKQADPLLGTVSVVGLLPAITTTANTNPTTVVSQLGNITVTGNISTVTATANTNPTLVTAPIGSLVIAGFSSTVTATTNINDKQANTLLGSVTVTGLAPVITGIAHRITDPSLGLIVVAGLAPTVAISDQQTVAPSTGSVITVGYAAGASVSVDARPQLGIVSIAGYAPAVTLTAHQIIRPAVGTATVLGLVPLITSDASVLVEPALGIVNTTGITPVVVTTGHFIAYPPTATLIALGAMPTITATVTVISATLSGTILDNTKSEDLLAGGRTIILTLTNDAWVE